MSKENDDLFEEQSTVPGEGESKTFGEPVKVEEGAKEEPPEPPAEGQEDQKVSKAEKMIPESRFKAALKDATEKLEAAQAELSQLKATPVPDKETDPEGYDLHVRMEASKAAMRATHADYQDVINHYAEMAKVNPFLNEAVAKHPVPAKYAYELAKEDLRIQRLRALEDSDEYKEFKEWKASQPAKTEPSEAPSEEISKKLASGAPKVPNLNRATNVSLEAKRPSEDDELFKGAL
jgi:hypothetical protein